VAWNTIRSASFKARDSAERWTIAETRKFYHGLKQCGTDFSMYDTSASVLPVGGGCRIFYFTCIDRSAAGCQCCFQGAHASKLSGSKSACTNRRRRKMPFVLTLVLRVAFAFTLRFKREEKRNPALVAQMLENREQIDLEKFTGSSSPASPVVAKPVPDTESSSTAAGAATASESAPSDNGDGDANPPPPAKQTRPRRSGRSKRRP